jgi:hypothetical protein
MEQNNNIITHVEGLPNIGGIVHVEKHGEKKQQKNMHKQNEKQHGLQENKLNTTVTAKDDCREKNNDDEHSIDYCA